MASIFTRRFTIPRSALVYATIVVASLMAYTDLPFRDATTALLVFALGIAFVAMRDGKGATPGFWLAALSSGLVYPVLRVSGSCVAMHVSLAPGGRLPFLYEFAALVLRTVGYAALVPAVLGAGAVLAINLTHLPTDRKELVYHAVTFACGLFLAFTFTSLSLYVGVFGR